MLDAWNQVGPECPKCGHVVTADEPHYYDPDEYTKDKCDRCGIEFEVSVEQTVAWSTQFDDEPDDCSPSANVTEPK